MSAASAWRAPIGPPSALPSAAGPRALGLRPSSQPLSALVSPCQPLSALVSLCQPLSALVSPCQPLSAPTLQACCCMSQKPGRSPPAPPIPPGRRSQVRTKIKDFAATSIGQPVAGYPCPPYKIIILDEADSMTEDAQVSNAPCPPSPHPPIPPSPHPCIPRHAPVFPSASATASTSASVAAPPLPLQLPLYSPHRSRPRLGLPWPTQRRAALPPQTALRAAACALCSRRFSCPPAAFFPHA